MREVKVKVFKFLVSNWTSIVRADMDRNFDRGRAELATPEEIERTVNDFLSDREIISVTVNSVDVNYHNNGRGNKIELWYNIVYSE